jgi:hypothetical protein
MDDEHDENEPLELDGALPDELDGFKEEDEDGNEIEPEEVLDEEEVI